MNERKPRAGQEKEVKRLEGEMDIISKVIEQLPEGSQERKFQEGFLEVITRQWYQATEEVD